MNIGKVIRSLRKQHQITQEKLAESLNISYQAVSKWENGTALPDITLIPSIANFFGVTTDELFEMTPNPNSQKQKDYELEYNRLHALGDVKSMKIVMQKALKEFPRNDRFMLNLAQTLTNFNDL